MPCKRFCHLLAALLLCLAAPLAAFAGQPLELVIAHVNDTHSHLEPVQSRLKVQGRATYLGLGGMPQLGARLAALRQKHPGLLFLHAGDAVQGTLYFQKYHGKIEMQTLAALGCAAMVLGNHEFDRGPKGAARIIGWARFPVLAANLDASQRPGLRARLRPYVIKQIGKARLGIIGLITPQTATASAAGPTLRFLPVVPTARRYVAELRAKGVNKIILLTHQGFFQDLKTARQVDGVDLIIGGHSHTLIGEAKQLTPLGLTPKAPYPTKVKGPSGRPVYVVQAWKWGMALGVLRTSWDAKGNLTLRGADCKLVASGPFLRKDASGKKSPAAPKVARAITAALKANPSVALAGGEPAISAMIQPYTRGLGSLRKKIIAKAARDMYNTRIPGSGPHGPDLPQGSQVAPLVARSMLNKLRADGMKVDFALMNAGGVRTDIMAGPVSVADVYNLLPFGNTLVTLELSGQKVKQALEWGVSHDSGGFPYGFGIRYHADLNQPKGARISKIQISGHQGGWKALDPAATYRLVTNSFLAQGGNGYRVFLRARKNRYDTGLLAAEAFMWFAKRTGVLAPLKDNGVYYTPAQ